MTITEACIKLAEGGHIDGAATQNSRVRRLMRVYAKWQISPKAARKTKSN